ncbi:MAG: putative metal-binding motif-containing protein [Myxococcota bacterium]
MGTQRIARKVVASITVAAGALAAGCPQPEPAACTTFEEVFVYVDADGDGYGSDEPVGYVCTVGEGQSLNNVDCDDDAPDVHPDAAELCDQLDNDCNGQVDEAVLKVPWYEDADQDGFGAGKTRVTDCAPPGPTWIQLAGDCDDTNADVNPSEREVCNGIDDDCDRFADDDDPGVDPGTYTRWFADTDSDGYGDPYNWIEACAPPAGTVGDDSDCDDTRGQVNPLGTERCNMLDDDCNGLTDDEDPNVDPATQQPMYADLDGDGHGDADNPILACGPVPGIASFDDLDCDDNDPLASLSQNWLEDNDGDGYGAGPPVIYTCLNPGGGLVPETDVLDCDDNDQFHSPATPEICDDGIDQNCNLDVDCDDSDCSQVCLAPCADLMLDPTFPQTTNGSTTNRGNDLVPSCVASSTAPDVVLQWVPPADGTYTIDLQGSNYDTVLYVKTGCGGGDVVCNDDYFGLQSRVQFTAVGGVPILIVVDGYGANSGSYTLNIY